MWLYTNIYSNILLNYLLLKKTLKYEFPKLFKILKIEKLYYQIITKILKICKW